jgi:uncharacterized protein
LLSVHLIASLLAVVQQLELPAPPRGYGASAADVVVDAAGVLSGTAIDRLNAVAFDMYRGTGGEIAIVVLPDLRGRDDAEIALRIGREWGVGSNAPIGSRLRNAGIVVLVVPRETSSDGRGHVRIEVGRGAEGFMPDAVAGDIQRASIPYFQRGDYDGALLTIAAGVADRFAREFGVPLDSSLTSRPPPVAPEPAGPRPRVGGGVSPGTVLFFLVVVFFMLSGARRGGRRGGMDGCLSVIWAMALAQSHGHRGHRRGGWGGGWGGGGFGGGSFGGGGGGGFGGFGGGGGFSGGGSSGSW